MTQPLQPKTAKAYYGLRQCTWRTLTATKRLTTVEGKTLGYGCDDHAKRWLEKDI